MGETTGCRIELPMVLCRVGTDIVFVHWVSESWELQRASLWVVVEVVDYWCEGMVL